MERRQCCLIVAITLVIQKRNIKKQPSPIFGEIKNSPLGDGVTNEKNKNNAGKKSY